jgi:hypothetical protein
VSVSVVMPGHIGTDIAANSAEVLGRHRPGHTSSRQTHDRLRISIRDTLGDVTLPISVRLDDEAARALRALEATGLSRSDAIRSSLIASADRLRTSRVLAAEVAALEADEDDRREMLAVAELMESMRAEG